MKRAFVGAKLASVAVALENARSEEAGVRLPLKPRFDPLFANRPHAPSWYTIGASRSQPRSAGAFYDVGRQWADTLKILSSIAKARKVCCRTIPVTPCAMVEQFLGKATSIIIVAVQRNSRMVALPPIADIPLHCGKRRFGPDADSRTATTYVPIQSLRRRALRRILQPSGRKPWRFSN
jgi:hypothetical protein